MNKESKKVVDEFFEVAEGLAEKGFWNAEMQEVMDDLSTGCDPQTALDDLRKLAEGVN